MLGMKTGNNEHRCTMKVHAVLLVRLAFSSFITGKDQWLWMIKNRGNYVKTIIIRKGQAVPSESRWITFVGWHWVNWPCVCQVLDLEECRWMEFDLMPLGLHPPQSRMAISQQIQNNCRSVQEKTANLKKMFSAWFCFWRRFVFLRTVRTAGLSFWSLV